MFDKILHSNLIKGNKAYGVHINHERDNTIYRVVLLQKKKNKIELEEKELRFESIEAFAEKCDKNIPLILSFDSKQVLSKKVQTEEGLKPLEYLLPNASEKDFYTLEWKLTETEKHISAVRKDILTPVIKSFSEKGFMILKTYLGFFAIRNIIGIADDLEKEFTASNYTIKIQDGIPEIKKTNENNIISYEIGEEFISSEFLLAFAAAIDFYIDGTSHGNEDLVIDKEEFLYKQLFTKSGWAILIFMFLVLLINYMFYMRLDNKRNELNSTYSQNIGLISRLDTLRKEVAFKESFLGKKGFLKKSITSYYADRIAASVPGDITLTDLNIYPLDKQIKTKEAVDFNILVIKVKGMYLRSTVLNKWIVELEEYDWINNIEIISLIQEKVNAPGEFELLMNLE